MRSFYIRSIVIEQTRHELSVISLFNPISKDESEIPYQLVLLAYEVIVLDHLTVCIRDRWNTNISLIQTRRDAKLVWLVWIHLR